MKIAALILAAGKASRMGEVKQLLPYNKKTLLGTVIENALHILPNDVFVVLGAYATEIKKKHEKFNVRFIFNEDYQSGLGSSIRKGVQTLKKYDAILILLADQPKVDIKCLKQIITEYKRFPQSITASNYGNFNGVPAVFPAVYFDALLQLKGDKGAKELLNSKNISIHTIPFSDQLQDIDTLDDYNKLIST